MAETAPPRWIEMTDLDSIQEALRNAKAHDRERIGASIGRFGYIEPMVLDERTGRLIAGHGRLHDLRARREAGEDPPEGVVADQDGRWRVPLSRGWQSRSDAEADAVGVALNRITEVGGWESDLLTELLTELRDVDPELLEVTGFAADDLDSLLAVHGQAPSLDDLERQHGTMGEGDDWVKVQFTAPQHVAAAWIRFAATHDTEGAAFTALLGDLVSDLDEL